MTNRRSSRSCASCADSGHWVAGPASRPLARVENSRRETRDAAPTSQGHACRGVGAHRPWSGRTPPFAARCYRLKELGAFGTWSIPWRTENSGYELRMLPLRALEGVARVDLSVHIRLKTIPIAAIWRETKPRGGQAECAWTRRIGVSNDKQTPQKE